MKTTHVSLLEVSRKSSKMKILVRFLLYVVIVFEYSMGDSSQLESKLLNGHPLPNERDQLFMASLQINHTHMCNAGMFRLGFLISAASCLLQMQREQAASDVVMGSYNLDEGERLEILDIVIYRNFFGILRVELTERIKDIGNTITFPLLNKKSFRIIDHGNEVQICGWGPTADSENYSNSLHFVNVQVQNWNACTSFNHRKGYDYKYRYHCGYEGHAKKLTLKDQGSPVTKKYEGHDGNWHYIIGITVGEFVYQSNHYVRFLKVSTIFGRVAEIVKRLELDDNDGDTKNDIKSSRNSTGSSSPRVKDDHLADDAQCSATVPNKHRRLE